VKILLTGAAGVLGRAIRQAAPETMEPVCLDIAPGGDPNVHEGSFTDPATLEQFLPGCDAVIHTAALHGGHRATHTPTQFTEVNVAGLVTLLEMCLKYKVKRCVFSSTMEVVIGVDWAASGMAVVDERTAPNPDWIYPLNKLLCEEVGACYHYRYGLEFVALRYMAFDDRTGLTPHLLARYVMPGDVARANLQAATLPGLGAEVLHIGPETPLTRQDIVQAASDPYGVVDRYWPGASQVLKTKGVSLEHRHFWPVTRIDRAKRILGWRPEATFETYLESLGWRGPVCA